MAQRLPTLIQVRFDTAANWATIDPVLSKGEFGFECDSGVLRIGDGVKVFTLLPGLQTGTVTAPTTSVNGDILSNPNFIDGDKIQFTVEGQDVTATLVGTAGHRILDANGTALTQRDDLQFVGDVAVIDDVTFGRTVVSIKAPSTPYTFENDGVTIPEQGSVVNINLTGDGVRAEIPGGDSSTLDVFIPGVGFDGELIATSAGQTYLGSVQTTGPSGPDSTVTTYKINNIISNTSSLDPSTNEIIAFKDGIYRVTFPSFGFVATASSTGNNSATLTCDFQFGFIRESSGSFATEHSEEYARFNTIIPGASQQTLTGTIGSRSVELGMRAGDTVAVQITVTPTVTSSIDSVRGTTTITQSADNIVVDTPATQGHIIQNAAETNFIQRNHLQFIGATVSDDSTDDRTIVTIDSTTIDGFTFSFNATTDWTEEGGQFFIDFTHNLNSDNITWQIYDTINTGVLLTPTKESNARLRITLDDNERFAGQIYIEKVG